MKKLQKFLVAIIICAMLFSLSSCGFINDWIQSQTNTYTIQYTDDSGPHTLVVDDGMPYSLYNVPSRVGYDFMGLYDAEVGGTQYVSSNGSSISAFTDKKNIVLFPQFKAKEYTIILDYQGADITGSRSMKVAYGSEINELPLNVTLENYIFKGWYTAPNCDGNQIADSHGVLPESSKVSEKLFDLSDPNGYIRLYAGFKLQEYTVTFYADENSAPINVKVEHGAEFNTIAPEIKVNNKMVISWSKIRNDVNKTQIYNSPITSDMILYAAEYAPFLEFDTNGGNAISSIMARAGERILLPEPTKTNYKFLGWQTQSGGLISSITMPENSTRLVAQWQAMLVFDTNGGAIVENISEAPGTEIDLPVTERAGYLFAGWYTENGKPYVSTIMPTVGTVVKAGWYQEKSATVTAVSSSKSVRIENEDPSISKLCYTFDFNNYLGGQNKVPVRIVLHAKLNTDIAKSRVFVNIYSQKTVSSAYLLAQKEFLVTTSQYRDFTLEASFEISSDFYICWSAPDAQYWGIRMDDVLLTDFYYTVYYTDMSNLIL